MCSLLAAHLLAQGLRLANRKANSLSGSPFVFPLRTRKSPREAG
jgi:hypothetical protein